MPDNEVGDRVHNFFAQDNLSQDQYRAPVVEGGWPQLGSNQWAGSQRQLGLPNSSSKNYNLQQSDTEREHGSHSFSPQQHLNLAQSTFRPDPAKSQPQVQNPNINGYMHGNRISQTRQNEANFLGMGTEFNSHNMTSRGLSMYESQQGHGAQTHTTTIRSESSDSPVGFDFFGGQQQQMSNQQQQMSNQQQQVSSQQTGMQHSLMLQQSGFGDTRMLQQQAIMRRMHELHRQQQNQQVETRQQNSVQQISSFAEHGSGSHSPALFNGTPIAASNYPWMTDPSAGNTNWIQNPSPAFQEASNGFRSPPEQNQAISSMGMAPQHTNQSLFGVPVSRGASNQFSNISLNKPSAQQMAMYSNSVSINQRSGFHDQVTMQEGSPASRQGFQAENLFGNASGPGSTRGKPSDNLQQVNTQQRNAPVHEFHEKLQLAGASETLQEKTGMRVSSQNAAAALDPTEEKILFGDDNIWEAFGSDAIPAAGNPLPLNGTDSFSGFPSLQSGSWSALMQSAVAETSSNDTGFQEEWNGLSFQNSDVSTKNRQSSIYEHNADQSMRLAEKNLQSGTALNSGSLPFSTDANASNSYLGIPGFQQSRQNSLSNQGEKLKTASTQRPTHQSSEAGNKWLSRGPPQNPLSEEKNYGNGAHSLDAQINTKSISGSWPLQQTVSSYKYGQPHNKPDGHEDGDSMSGSGDVASQIRGNLSMGSSQMHGGDYSLRNLAEAPNNIVAGGSRNASQVLPDSQNLNYWKHAEASLQNKGNESSGKFQHHLNNGPQVMESTVSSPGNVGVNHDMESCDRTENSCDSHQSSFSQHDTPVGSRENVWLDGNDSRNVSKQKPSVQAGRKTSGSKKFQYHPMGNLDEDVDRSTGTKQVTLSQAMFQQGSRAPFTYNQGLFDQSKLYGQSTNNSSENRKGHPPDQGTRRNETSRGSLLPNASATFSSPVHTSKDSQSSQNMLELLHKVNQSKEGYSDSFAGQYRQSQSSASQGFGLQLGPPSQGFPIQNRALPSQSSAQIDSFSSSHMTPEIRERDHAWSPSPSQVQSLQSSRGTPQGNHLNNQLGASEHTANEALHAGFQANVSASLNSGIPHSGNRVHNQQVVRGSGKVTENQPMNPSFNRNASYFQQNASSSSRPPSAQPLTTSFPDTAGLDSNYKPASSEETPQLNDTNDPQRRASSAQISAGRALGTPQPSVASGISQQGAFRKIVGNAWSSVPGQQQLSGAPPHKFHPGAFQLSESDKQTLTSSLHPNRENHDLQKGGNGPSNVGATSMDSRYTCGEGQQSKDGFHRLVSPENSDMAEKVSASPGKESLTMDPEASPSNSSSTQKDIEAFGRSLKPNSLSNQKYSLLQQMRAMKSTEIDPNIGGTKRLKVGDGAVGYQSSPSNEQFREHNAIVRDSSVRHGAAPFGDTNMLSFSGPVDNREKNASSQLGNTPPNANSFARKDSENLSSNSTVPRVENSQISPQMAPSWFNQFGTFTKGQMLQMYDARKHTTSKAVDQPLRFGTASDGLHLHNSLEQVNPRNSSPVVNVWEKSTPASVAIEQISSSQALAQDVTDQPSVLRKKKRKTATSELLPWHKEVTQSSQSLLSISAAEVSWAKATNRIKEKVEDQDGQKGLRPKRRLILTTHLMQQLFLPPPAALLSGDASSNYEAVVYQVARMALGNTCSGIPCSGSDVGEPLDNSNLLPGKPLERVGGQNFSEAVEDFLSRARKLENDFVRLDKRASVLDLRIESQDIERFSVINRFAKFHIRGQPDAGEASSSSDASASSQALLLQRYVTALPVPRNLPDRAQCLSL